MNNYVLLIIMSMILFNDSLSNAMEQPIDFGTDESNAIDREEIDKIYRDNIIYNNAVENKIFRAINPFYEPLILTPQALLIIQKHGKNNGFESESKQISIIYGDGIINFHLPLIEHNPLNTQNIFNQLLYEEKKEVKRDLCNFIETVYYELAKAQADQDDDTHMTYGLTAYIKHLNDIFPWVSGKNKFQARRNTTGSPGSSPPKSSSPSGSPTFRKLKEKFSSLSPMKKDKSRDSDNNNA